MPLRVWREWDAFSRIEPFGDQRADVHTKWSAMALRATFAAEGTELSTDDYRLPWEPAKDDADED